MNQRATITDDPMTGAQAHNIANELVPEESLQPSGSQGAKAVKAGLAFEKQGRDYIESLGFPRPGKYAYKASWYNIDMNRADIYVPEINHVAEFKFQKTAGTADQKICTEVLNAYKTVPTDTYIYVYDGPETKTRRWAGLVALAKESIELIEVYGSRHPAWTGTKKVMIMPYTEYQSWVAKAAQDYFMN